MSIKIISVKAAAIKPAAKGQSDFFSWNLYRYIKKERPDFHQVWIGFPGDEFQRGLYIGNMETLTDGTRWFHGVRLRTLCSGIKLPQSYAYSTIHMTPQWIDKTEEFWKDYMQRGVCAIHGDLVHRWVESEQGKCCEYCGKLEAAAA